MEILTSLRFWLLLLGIGLVVGIYLYSRYRRKPLAWYQQDLDEMDAAWERESGDAESRLGDNRLQRYGQMRHRVSLEPGRVGRLSDKISSCGFEYGKTQPMEIKVNILPVAKDHFSSHDIINAINGLGFVRAHGAFEYREKCLGNQKLFMLTAMDDGQSLQLENARSYNGITLVLRLAWPMDCVLAFEKQMSLAQTLAARLEAMVCDDARNRLTRQRVRHYKDEISQQNLQVRWHNQGYLH